MASSRGGWEGDENFLGDFCDIMFNNLYFCVLVPKKTNFSSKRIRHGSATAYSGRRKPHDRGGF
jgi:hypothetical protein